MVWYCCSSLGKKKEYAANHAKIRLQGRVFDSSFNRGVGAVAVRAYWQDGGICCVCPELEVAAGQTNSFGYFELSFVDDTIRFGLCLLHVQVEVPANYISELADHRDQVYWFSSNHDADLRKMWLWFTKRRRSQLY